MARQVIVVEGRAFDPTTGRAIGYRPGEPAEAAPAISPEEVQRLESERKKVIEEAKQREISVQEARVSQRLLAREERIPTVETRVVEERIRPKIIEPTDFREKGYQAIGEIQQVGQEYWEKKIGKYPSIMLGSIASVGFEPAKFLLRPKKYAEETAKGVGTLVGTMFEKEIPRYDIVTGKEIEKLGIIGLTKEQKKEIVYEQLAAAAPFLLAGAVGLGLKGYRKISKPKITEIRTPALAIEEVRFGLKGRYKVAAKPQVFIKKPFRKPKVIITEVAGRVGVEPTPRELFFEARGVYIGRLPKKPISVVAKAKSIIKVETPKTIKQLTATEVYLGDKVATAKQRFISGGYGYKVAQTPKGELWATTGRAIELIKKPKPIIEKGLTIVKRIPTEKIDFGFGLRVPTKTVTKTPTPLFIGEIEKIARVVAVPKTPTPIKLVKPVPKVSLKITPTKQVMPSPYEGLGLYERTEEVSVPSALITQQQVKTRLLARVKSVSGLMTQQEIKQQVKQQLKQISQQATKVKIEQKQLQRQRVAQLQQQEQMQKQLQRQQQKTGFGLSFVQPTPTLAEATMFVPTGKTPEEIKRILKKVKKVTGFQTFIKRAGIYKPIGKVLPRAKAIKYGEKVARYTLAATFKIKPTKKVIAVQAGLPYKPSPVVFRAYKVKKGRRVPLRDEWIQRAKFRLGTRGEVQEIQKARKQTQFFKPAKRGLFL